MAQCGIGSPGKDWQHGGQKWENKKKMIMKCVVLKTRWVITSVFGMGIGSENRSKTSRCLIWLWYVCKTTDDMGLSIEQKVTRKVAANVVAEIMMKDQDSFDEELTREEGDNLWTSSGRTVLH